MKSLKVNKISVFFKENQKIEFEGQSVVVPIFSVEELTIFAPLMDKKVKGSQFKDGIVKLIDTLLLNVFPDSSEEERKRFPLSTGIKLVEKIMEINGFEVDSDKKKELLGMT